MATREENLEKINTELELMNDEELEQVAGGHFAYTGKDNKFLIDMGYMTETVKPGPFGLDWYDMAKKVNDGWAAAGVTAKLTFIGDNKYFIGDKEVSREEAFKYAARGRNYNYDRYFYDCD